jgi:hypothetical protein
MRTLRSIGHGTQGRLLNPWLCRPGLNCTGLLKVTDPVTLTFANGVVVDATIQGG